MRKDLLSVDDVKKRIMDLKGLSVKMEVNRGRNRIDSFDAVIVEIYPSVFTVSTFAKLSFNKNKTFSYLDVLCGDVRISEG